MYRKILSLVAAAGAVAVMSVLTVTGNAAFVADTTTQTTPPPTPSIASAAPKVKPTGFVGGDWPGMASFGADMTK